MIEVNKETIERREQELLNEILEHHKDFWSESSKSNYMILSSRAASAISVLIEKVAASQLVILQLKKEIQNLKE